jgi:hypothetical protein
MKLEVQVGPLSTGLRHDQPATPGELGLRPNPCEAAPRTSMVSVVGREGNKMSAAAQSASGSRLGRATSTVARASTPDRLIAMPPGAGPFGCPETDTRAAERER